MPFKIVSKPCKKRVVKRTYEPCMPLQPLNKELFRQECLIAHNRYRRLHCGCPVRICPRLNEFATQWALNLARIGKVESRHDNRFGENLYMAENINVSGDLPVTRWYEEIKDFEFANPKMKPSVSHFTQVIWKNTEEIGIGVERRDNTTFVVVIYYPPGNVESQLQRMVPRPVL